jgi:uncharacterized protein (DUF885 family)
VRPWLPTIAAAALLGCSGSEAVEALGQRYWDFVLEEFPVVGTYVGDTRFADRDFDYSKQGSERRAAFARELLAGLGEVDRSQLSEEELLSVEVMEANASRLVEADRHWLADIPLYPPASFGLTQETLARTRLRNTEDGEQWVYRLRNHALALDALREKVVLQYEQGIIYPRYLIDQTVTAIEELLATAQDEGPFHVRDERFAEGFPEGEKARIRDGARTLVQQGVDPALRRLVVALRGDYRAEASREIGLVHRPGGLELYRFLVSSQATAGLTPREIHELGLREVARLHSEFEAKIRALGLAGSRRELFDELRRDPRFQPASAEALQQGYTAILERIAERIAPLFRTRPVFPLVVRREPAWSESSAAGAHYSPPTLSPLAPGIFYFNASALADRPTWEMETLAYHEGIPGHHLQIVVAAQNLRLPWFRRANLANAYTEGWALYAETLAGEVGGYSDPYSELGNLNHDLWRSARLVVDTGIHELGWSNEQAVVYLLENTALTESTARREVLRYAGQPAQALGYKLGQLRILELRRRAQERLGERFELAEFHDAVLTHGALDLDLLERHVERWIEAGGRASGRERLEETALRAGQAVARWWVGWRLGGPDAVGS